MNKITLFAAALVFSAVSAWALPTLSQLPGNLGGLIVSKQNQSSIEAVMKEKGLGYPASAEDFYKQFAAAYPPEVVEKLKVFDVYSLLTQAKSIAYAYTVDADALPNGVFIYLQGTFDAPATMRKIVDDKDFKATMEQLNELNELASLRVETKNASPAITFQLSAIPPDMVELYPPLANGFSLTLAATAPDTLTLVSSGITERLAGGAPDATLSSSSPFAACLRLGEKDFLRGRFEKISASASVIRARVFAKVPPELQGQINMLFNLPFISSFFNIDVLDMHSFEDAAGSYCSTAVFAAVSETEAENLQEMFIGYKGIIRNFFSLMMPQMGEVMGAEAAQAYWQMLELFIDKVKIGAPRGKTVTVSTKFTPDEMIVLLENLKKFQDSVKSL